MEEDWAMVLCFKAYGSKWKRFCQYLPGRTENCIKNRWNCKLKRKIPGLMTRYEEFMNNK